MKAKTVPGEERERRGCKGARPTKEWRSFELESLRREEEGPVENWTEEAEQGAWIEGRADLRDDIFHVADADVLAHAITVLYLAVLLLNFVFFIGPMERMRGYGFCFFIWIIWYYSPSIFYEFVFTHKTILNLQYNPQWVTNSCSHLCQSFIS